MRLHTDFPPALPSDLKLTNRFQVLDSFLTHGICSANDISAEIGLSRQTVMKSIQFFLQTGMISSIGKGTSTTVGGKRPELYALSPNKYFLCISLWPLDMRLHLYTIGGNSIDQITLKTPLPNDPKVAIANAGELARRILVRNNVSLSNICAVSLSTAGTIDYKSSRLKFSSQSPTWGCDIPLADYLKSYFAPNTLIFLENAGKMVARPFLQEPSLSEKRVLTIFSCWGLSSCLIEKNHILSGKNSLIGEIGHMVIDPSDAERCGCGNNGCLERLVSTQRIHAMIDAERDNYPESVLLCEPIDKITIPALFFASAKEDLLARKVVDYLASIFAVALKNITLIFDPDLIVFQGDYANADNWFDRRLRTHLQGFQYFPEEGPFDILYDRRPLNEMDSLGSYIALTQQYFSAPEHYMDKQIASLAP